MEKCLDMTQESLSPSSFPLRWGGVQFVWLWTIRRRRTCFPYVATQRDSKKPADSLNIINRVLHTDSACMCVCVCSRFHSMHRITHAHKLMCSIKFSYFSEHKCPLCHKKRHTHPLRVMPCITEEKGCAMPQGMPDYQDGVCWCKVSSALGSDLATFWLINRFINLIPQNNSPCLLYPLLACSYSYCLTPYFPQSMCLAFSGGTHTVGLYFCFLSMQKATFVPPLTFVFLSL